MSEVASPLPMRRPELAVSPLGEQGKHVVKDPVSGDYFHLGAVEAFLLEKLDGQHTPAQICAAFEARFDDPLTTHAASCVVPRPTSRFCGTSVGVHDRSGRLPKSSGTSEV